MSRNTYYEWLDADSEFAETAKVAKQEAIENLESEAYHRAHIGDLKPVCQGGRSGISGKYQHWGIGDTQKGVW